MGGGVSLLCERLPIVTGRGHGDSVEMVFASSVKSKHATILFSVR